ncbi:ATP-dependent DNA helicase [candidate division KSB3 bacterium]|uniref:ATP-dependent DNA helicase n=1 Tax=candidate division KSB3 bacterium TaxID=2044937 RepID=A0A9D5Q573_9BACT|nr:ATP-dependent DNA helicase [candidate division KSB3 bacterium]MBD3323626.1 ATP-dependent DNA helicase [candidate division KSB3 bacterium]
MKQRPRPSPALADLQAVFAEDGVLANTLPYYEYRAEQVEMSLAVAEAFRHHQHLIVEAGTGVGKTLAYLIPAVVSGVKTVVSTGTKNLQEQLFFKDIPYLKRYLSREFYAVYMKGRSNYLCLKRLNLFRQEALFQDTDEVKMFQRIQRWATQTTSGDRMELGAMPENYGPWREVCCTRDTCNGRECELYDDCFLFKMKHDAEEADLVIVNHHLFFADLAIKGLKLGEVIPPYDAVIFDEAHLLESIATAYFSVSVNSYQAEETMYNVLRELTNAGIKEDRDAITNTLHTLQQVSQRLFHCFESDANRYRLRDDLIDKQVYEIAPDVANTLLRLSTQLRALKESSEELHAIAGRVDDMQSALELILNRSEPGYVYWCENRGRGVLLHASPIDIADDMRRNIFQKIPRIVLTSATLSSGNHFQFVKERLGIDQPVELIVDSPFEYEQQTLLYLPPSMPAPNSKEFTAFAASEIERILEKSQGRAFVLFTSYKNMEEVYRRLKSKLPYKLLKQGQKGRNALLEAFKKDTHSVLFGTSSFWQGVDVQGEALSCVIIDKLPFAAPSEPIVEARIEHLRNRGEDPFMTYQVPSAIITLKQGLGRLIRSKQDSGILCILDSRLLTKQYGRLFLESLPRFPIVRDVQAIRIPTRSDKVGTPSLPQKRGIAETPITYSSRSLHPSSEWERTLGDKDLSTAKPYSMYDVFAEGDLIAHEGFGYGIITALRPENKIEVWFQTGRKVLAHDQVI